MLHSSLLNIAALDAVREGYRPIDLEQLAEEIEPGESLFKYRIVPKPTLARVKARKARLTREQSEKVLALRRVWSAALDLWHDDADAARRFLNRPNPLLEGATPLNITLASVTGAQLVVEFIGQSKAGVAA
ncbi:MAG: DUF2384 domain-containing protein [Rhodobiaceae bacterium]|nr:DUF2384 domain-containing protein [Rhodobiaceae bacterium]MCC0013535.1 DUF2384 domain-containing protein [Rhodobiaceae bacterium]MCC0018927.1 DUF2384 domain-containing protein [Rhodobiaceae bacterium]MCC0051182.1 DUF2384 domain-containing protein [Rhodobiaceae bacterium]MCC0059968.1 DUF2384 domain-containing protein [Rhodobiaceae bacterium]